MSEYNKRLSAAFREAVRPDHSVGSVLVVGVPTWADFVVIIHRVGWYDENPSYYPGDMAVVPWMLYKGFVSHDGRFLY